MASQHRKPRSPGTRVAGIRTPGLATAAFTSVALLSQTANAAPSDDGTPSLEEVEKKVDDLYRRAESATEKSSTAKERAPRQRRQADGSPDDVAQRTRGREETRERPGSSAAARYRTGASAPEKAASLLAAAPRGYFDQDQLMSRLSERRRNAADGQLTERPAAAGRRQAATGSPAATDPQNDLRTAKAAVQKKLGDARELLSVLTAQENARLAAVERQRREEAAAELARQQAAARPAELLETATGPTLTPSPTAPDTWPSTSTATTAATTAATGPIAWPGTTTATAAADPDGWPTAAAATATATRPDNWPTAPTAAEPDAWSTTATATATAHVPGTQPDAWPAATTAPQPDAWSTTATGTTPGSDAWSAMPTATATATGDWPDTTTAAEPGSWSATATGTAPGSDGWSATAATTAKGDWSGAVGAATTGDWSAAAAAEADTWSSTAAAGAAAAEADAWSATVGTPSTDHAYVTKAEKALAFARAQIGKPCLWGAAGPGSYDCSGLAQAAWRAAGVTLPRTAQDQATAGTTVPLADARPGDLLFFHDDAGHVGIHSGNGMMIHAPGPGTYVREEPVHHDGASAVRSVLRPA